MIYGFKSRFVPPILAGTKTGTIRAPRAGKQGHARPGTALQLKHGSRYRPVFFADTTCTELLAVSLVGMSSNAPSVVIRELGDGPLVELVQGGYALDRFAISDGFADWEDLCRFWWDTHKARDFTGAWIRWLGAEVKAR